MNKQHILISASCLLLAVASAKCADKQPAPAPAAAAPKPNNTFTGKVVETMDAGSYTYLLVDTGKEKNWAAVPKTRLAVGDTVTVPDGMPMAKYQSKILKREFDVVYFAGGLKSGSSPSASGSAAGKLPPGHPPLAGAGNAKLPDGHPPLAGAGSSQLPQGHPPIGSGAVAAPKVDLSGIKKPKGGKTIAEIYSDAAKLNGKEVVVRGKVVKYNAGIMNKNWLHIQDGTGAEGGNDLTLTTSATAKVGDTVLANGVLTTDKDFGYGYKFKVIIENAEVVVE